MGGGSRKALWRRTLCGQEAKGGKAVQAEGTVGAKTQKWELQLPAAMRACSSFTPDLQAATSGWGPSPGHRWAGLWEAAVLQLPSFTSCSWGRGLHSGGKATLDAGFRGGAGPSHHVPGPGLQLSGWGSIPHA